jgi:predicted Rossmann-fold nucleotide-binding protein
VGLTENSVTTILAQAAELAAAFAARQYEMIYGGGAVGLMGALADEMLKAQVRFVALFPLSCQRKKLVIKPLMS